MVSPLEFAFLAHSYVSPEPYPTASPAAAQAARFWQDNGMLVPRYKDGGQFAGSFEVTDKGELWLKHVLATPLPVPTFYIPPHPVK